MGWRIVANCLDLRAKQMMPDSDCSVSSSDLLMYLEVPTC